jgi:hypothetical protein
VSPEKLAVDNSVDLEIQRRLSGAAPQAGPYLLGDILVNTGQITRLQLDEALLGQAKTGNRLGDELVQSGLVNRNQIERGLYPQRQLLVGAVVTALLLTPTAFFPTSAMAAPTTSLVVSAQVIASAKLQTEHQATLIRITSLDIARGYVNVTDATRITVNINSHSGYRLEFQPVSQLFESVHIDGLSHSVQLGADGGSIIQRNALQQHQSHTLTYRFMLQAHALAGEYPWPRQIVASAI